MQFCQSESCWNEMEDMGNEEVEWGALLRPPFGQADDSVCLRDDNHDRPMARRLLLIGNQFNAPAPKDMQTDSLQSHAIQSQVLSLSQCETGLNVEGGFSDPQCETAS